MSFFISPVSQNVSVLRKFFFIMEKLSRVSINEKKFNWPKKTLGALPSTRYDNSYSLVEIGCFKFFGLISGQKNPKNRVKIRLLNSILNIEIEFSNFVKLILKK